MGGIAISGVRVRLVSRAGGYHLGEPGFGVSGPRPPEVHFVLGTYEEFALQTIRGRPRHAVAAELPRLGAQVQCNLLYHAVNRIGAFG